MWNGLNTADRQQERRQRLLAAGVEIIGTHGVQSVNVRAICRAAKISERHFYETFATKDEFIIAMATAAVGPSDRPTMLARLVGAWIDFVHTDARRGRIIAVEAAANHALAQRGREVAFAMLQFCLAQTTPPHNNTSSPYDAATMEVTATVLVTGVWGLLLAWLGDGLAVAISRDDLVDQIVALILRALPT